MWRFTSYNFEGDFHYVFALFESKDFQYVFLNVQNATYVPTYVTNIREFQKQHMLLTYVNRVRFVRKSYT